MGSFSVPALTFCGARVVIGEPLPKLLAADYVAASRIVLWGGEAEPCSKFGYHKGSCHYAQSEWPFPEASFLPPINHGEQVCT